APLRAAAHLHQEQITLDNGRTADAEEVRDDAKLLVRIHLPHQLAIAGPDAVQHSVGAEEVYPIAVHDRAAARAAVVAKHIAVVRRVLEQPQRVGRLGVPAAQPAAIANAVEEVEPATSD